MAKTWSEKERARARASAISRTARRRPPRRNLVAGGRQAVAGVVA